MHRTYIRYRSIQRKNLRRSRITALVVFAIIVMISICLAFSTSVEASRAIDYQDANQVEAICVESGDSLWSIAEEYYSDYKGDIREVIHAIKKTNKMANSAIYAGQVLYLPKDV